MMMGNSMCVCARALRTGSSLCLMSQDEWLTNNKITGSSAHQPEAAEADTSPQLRKPRALNYLALIS